MSPCSRAPATALRRRPLAACLTSLLLAHAGVAAAVDNCNDAGPGSLREAIATAASGATVDLGGLACTSITLTSGALAIGVADLTLNGPKATTLTVRSAGGDRVVTHTGSGTLTLTDLHIAEGRSSGNGGCIATSGHLLATRVDVQACQAGVASNAATAGGAIHVAGNATLVDVELRDNRAEGHGLVRGGAIAAAGFVRATSSRFIDNSARSLLAGGGNPDDNQVEGGAIQSIGATTLIDSVVTGNQAYSESFEAFGGGVSTGVRVFGGELSSLTVRRSELGGNTVDSGCGVCAPQGGGAFVFGHALLDHATVRDNSVGSAGHYGGGGGVRFSGGSTSVEILDSTISGNSADSAGGGMIGPGGGSLSIGRTRIENNEAGNVAGTNEGGGGILCLSCTLQMVDSSLSGNHAGADGGAIALPYNDYLSATLANTTISANETLEGEGGGLFVDGGTVAISSSTIAFNRASDRGAGISAGQYTVTIDLQSTIVTGNSTDGSANNVWTFPKVTVGAHNLVNNAAGLPTVLPADTLSVDPLLLPLALNGGPTPNHAIEAGSPAIDAGNNAAGLVFDQRGEGYWREFGSASDIGAFELQPTPDVIFEDGFDD